MSNEQKTQVHAEPNRHDLFITRLFDLPVDLVFRAYTEPELLHQWMGTNVLKLENKRHGSWQFETLDPQGNVAFKANGTIHEFIPDKKITRTFEMENAGFPVQLEFLEFEGLTEDTSKLTIQIIHKTIEHRDKVLKMPFAYGLNMAHNRLQEMAVKIKNQRS